MVGFGRGHCPCSGRPYRSVPSVTNVLFCPAARKPWRRKVCKQHDTCPRVKAIGSIARAHHPAHWMSPLGELRSGAGLLRLFPGLQDVESPRRAYCTPNGARLVFPVREQAPRQDSAVTRPLLHSQICSRSTAASAVLPPSTSVPAFAAPHADILERPRRHSLQPGERRSFPRSSPHVRLCSRLAPTT